MGSDVLSLKLQNAQESVKSKKKQVEQIAFKKNLPLATMNDTPFQQALDSVPTVKDVQQPTFEPYPNLSERSLTRVAVNDVNL